MKLIYTILIISLLSINSCFSKVEKSSIEEKPNIEEKNDTIKMCAQDIKIEKNLIYDQHTLDDTYPYKKTTRTFQWDKIRAKLFLLDSIQYHKTTWAFVQNYKNKNGIAPIVRNSKKNDYNHVADSNGVERYQAAPLYLLNDSTIAERYIKDGSLVKLLEDDSVFAKIETISFKGEWRIPKKYIKIIDDSVVFTKAIFVDRTNQNIATLEKADSVWMVRSMNPITTGLRKPPYKYATPSGVFVIQDKTPKMLYLADGSHEIGGFAPYASRFSGGAYLHGVPLDEPRTTIVEISASLGTTPRSHMCVRNATSHAKFIYDWALSEQTVVFVFD